MVALFTNPVNTLDRFSLAIPPQAIFLIFFEFEKYLQRLCYLAMDRGS
jgi:hypothetical protein